MWLVGDILNVAGSILQGVLPTTIALAVYYTIADIVLLIQIFLYNRKKILSEKITIISSSTPLLEDEYSAGVTTDTILPRSKTSDTNLSTSHGTFDLEQDQYSSCDHSTASTASSIKSAKISFRRRVLINLLLVTGVIVAGITGWAVSQFCHSATPSPSPSAPLEFNFWGQVFGWSCAPIYLSSRIPQIVLNFKRKSVEGVSFLFFLFACLGNLNFIISIISLDTSWKYLLINGSWLAGSAGALFMDIIIFFQFWIYNCNEEEDEKI